MVSQPLYHAGSGIIHKRTLKLNNFKIKNKRDDYDNKSRGSESATLLQPRQKNLALLGLGYSIGTSKKGITANAVVVNSFAELKKRAEEVNFTNKRSRRNIFLSLIIIK